MIKIEINIILSNIFYLRVKIIENFFIKYFFFLLYNSCFKSCDINLELELA